MPCPAENGSGRGLPWRWGDWYLRSALAPEPEPEDPVEPEIPRGYYLERKCIFEYEAQKLISAQYAKKLRQNVNNLETYS